MDWVLPFSSLLKLGLIVAAVGYVTLQFYVLFGPGIGPSARLVHKSGS